MERSVVGEVVARCFLPLLCEEQGLGKVQVNLIGGLDEVMLVMENVKTVENILQDKDHGLRCGGDDERYGKEENDMQIDEKDGDDDEKPVSDEGARDFGYQKRQKRSLAIQFGGDTNYDGLEAGMVFNEGNTKEEKSEKKKIGRRSVTKAKEVARKTRVGLGENNKGMSDVYKEQYDAGSECNIIFRFKYDNEGESANSKCNVNMEQVKEIGEMIGVSWVAAEKEKERVKGREGYSGKKGWVRSVLKVEHPDVIGLEETKRGMVDEYWIEDLWGGKGFGFSQLPACGNSGGIILIWDARVFTCKEAIGDERFIAVRGSWKGKNEDVFLVCIYGPHVSRQKMSLWDRLTRLMNRWNRAWCIFRDLNVEACRDSNWGGGDFTRVSDDGIKFSKLDRFLLNDEFNNLWDSLFVIALDKKLSDHCPIMLKDVDLDFGPKPFREARILEKDFEEKEVWEAIQGCGADKASGPDVNGSPSEEFGLERVVRQGDPLSHFLFILAAEDLNAIVKKRWRKAFLKAHLWVPRVNYNKNKIYGIGVNEGDLTDMARWMGCDIGEFSFTYLGLPIGENMRRVRRRGILWVWMVKSIHGACGGLRDVRARGGGGGGGVWGDIVKIGEEIDGLGVDFTSFCVGVVGDGSDIRFWVNWWVDNGRLCDRFPRLYHLDGRKEVSVMDRGFWDDNRWVWEWDWVRNIRGRVCKELEDLLGALQHVVVSNNCRDQWRWSLDEDGEFTVKELSRLIEEKILLSNNGDQETLWNKLVPKKVNIFVWRALRERLLVRVELDRRGIDLDSVLCPSCNNILEACADSLITCDLAMSV
ncbi:reverse transcriptase domain, reverse transcriptase zinc-binding domain protein [Tanacetum coccineum]